MPAETHQKGRRSDAAGVAEFLAVVLDASSGEMDTHGREVRLADCGLTVDDVDWLWEAVCEEFSERSLAPELDSGEIEPAMTLAEAAEVMARVLATGREDDA